MKLSSFSGKLWSKDFTLINLICCIASYSNCFLQSLLPVFILDQGGSNTMIGVMITGHTALTMITNIAVAPLIDRIGRKKLLVLGGGLFFLNTLIFCFTENLTTLFILRVLCGFTTGIFFPILPVILSDVTDEARMVDAMGIFGVASAITFAVTPTIGLALYNCWGAKAMFASNALMGGISFAITLLVDEHYSCPGYVRTGVAHRTTPRINKALLQMMLMPLLANLIINFSNSSVNSFLTPCGLSRGLSQISLYFIVNYGVCIISRLFLGRVLGRIHKRTCMFAGILLTILGVGIISFAYSMPLMLISAAFLGIGFPVVTQLFQAESFLCVPCERRGLAGTAFMLFGNIGAGIGASVWGILSNEAGYATAYAVAGASAIFCLFVHRNYWKKIRD